MTNPYLQQAIKEGRYKPQGGSKFNRKFVGFGGPDETNSFEGTQAPALQQPVPQPKQGQDFGQMLKGGMDAVTNFGMQGASTVGGALGNIASMPGDIIEAGQANMPEGPGKFLSQVASSPFSALKYGIGEPLKNLSDTVSRQSLEATDRTENSASTQWGKGFGGIAATLAGSAVGGGVGAKAGAQGLGAASRFIQGNTKLASMVPKAGAFLGRSVGSTAGVTATEGRLPTGMEAGTGLAIDVVTLGASKLFKGLRNIAYADALGATPTEKALLAKNGIDIGDVMQQKVGFAPTKKIMIKKLDRAIAGLQSNVDDAIKNVDQGKLTTTDFSKKIISSFGDAQDDLWKATKGIPKKDRARVLKSFNDESLEWIKDLQGKKLGLGEIEEIYRDSAGRVNWERLSKKDLGVIKSIAPGEAGSQIANMQVRKGAGSIIDELAPSILQDKAKQSPLIALKNIMNKRGPRATGLTDVLGIGAAATTGNPLAGLATIIGGKFAQTPAARTGVATAADLMSKSNRFTSPFLKKLFMGEEDEKTRRKFEFNPDQMGSTNGRNLELPY